MIFKFTTLLRKSSCVLFSIYFIVLPLCANAGEQLNAYPAVWLVEGNNSKTYFLGSIHLLPKETKWYGGDIKTIFEQADEVVFEVHMTPEKEAAAQQLTINNGMLARGDLLSNYLAPEEYEYLIEQATDMGIPAASVVNFKPWFASVALSVSAIIREGWDPASGVDKFIEKKAVEKGIKISELETLETQMATLYDHPLDVQAAMLKDTLDQLKEIEEVTLEMIGSWASGDEESMEEAFIIPMQEQREIYEKLVVQRNNSWVPIIKGLIAKDQVTLVVAGAAHFIGEDGLVKLLEQAGYEVKRVQ